MSGIVAIVGRPNVGKSTFFNRMIQRREAIVDAVSGVTRDRHYGKSDWNGKEFSLIDTGGYVVGSDDVFEKEIDRQVELAIQEADAILFMVDAETGVTGMDEDVARLLRRVEKPVFLVVNKVDNNKRREDAVEFYSLGLGEYYPISSINGSGTGELLDALVRSASIDLVLVLMRRDQSLFLEHELNTLGCDIACVHASQQASRPNKAKRARSRSNLWNDYLSGAIEHTIDLDSLDLLGTPPRKAPEAWLGKQIAFLECGQAVAMGEVVGLTRTTLSVRLPPGANPTNTLLVRDACRDADGLITSSKRFADGVVRYVPPSDVLPDALIHENGVRPLVQVGSVAATLMNGVFGDPLLHLRLGQQRRSLLFDLGDGSRLPARIAHQVSDVFISHAHMDHISGFLWLLRSRIGETSVCRLYGPPGLSGHIEGLINGIRWDRIGDNGPLFHVLELDGDRLRTFGLQAGKAGRKLISEYTIQNGVLLHEDDFQVRAVTLDHGTPVLAFAYQPTLQIKVRKDRLQQRQLEPGPWLNALKGHIRAGDKDVEIQLTNGCSETVERLSADLTLISEGKKLVYATDFSDTPENRRRLISIAKGAHTLFCESTFLEQELEQARRYKHLTTRSCAEIANAADVEYLIPFHFSRRYEKQPWRVYDEIAALCPRVVMPESLR